MADADTIPSGSTESFNDFKDRIIGQMTGIQAENEGHNTVVVSHSKALNVISAWDHAGMPEDNSIHMPTFEKDNVKPGGHEEFEIPKHVMASRMEEQPSPLIPLDRNIGFNQQGNPMSMNSTDPMGIENLVKDVREGVYNPDTNPEGTAMLMAGIGKFPMGYFKPGGQGFDKVTKMLEEGSTGQDLMKEFGLSKGRISKIMSENNLRFNNKDISKMYPNRKVDPTEIKDMRDKGLSWRDIAKSFGVNVATAYRYK